MRPHSKYLDGPLFQSCRGRVQIAAGAKVKMVLDGSTSQERGK